MHTFHNVSHKGILSDDASVGRVLDIIQRYGRISNSSSHLQQRLRRSGPASVVVKSVAGAKRKGFFSFLKFAGEPFRRWNFTAPQAEAS